MTIKDISSVLTDCISETAVARVRFTYNDYFEMLFPLSVSNDLFVSVIDRDFILDGYTVRRISDVVEAQDIRKTYLSLHMREGNLKKLTKPPIDITTFRSLFSSLIKMKKYVIIEGRISSTGEYYFVAGAPLGVNDSALKFRSFDGAGKWCENTVTIPYLTIESVTFDSSYISTYSKYIKPYKETNKK